MENGEIEELKGHIIAEVVENVSDTVVIKSIIKKTTRNIGSVPFDTGEAFTKEISPFGASVQIIDTKTELLIDGRSHLQVTGQSIMMPDHVPNIERKNQSYNVISMVTKNGYK